jgi:hypothetical protein
MLRNPETYMPLSPLVPLAHNFTKLTFDNHLFQYPAPASTPDPTTMAPIPNINAIGFPNVSAVCPSTTHTRSYYQQRQVLLQLPVDIVHCFRL